MRLPELPGYRLEGLLDEDPFGWSFVALHESGARRLVRVFKGQATSDRVLHSYFKVLSDPKCPFQGVARIHDYLLQDTKGLTACALPFYGWKTREREGWQVSSLRRISSMLSREQVLEVITDLASALAELHEAGLFHGGLRPTAVYLAGDAKGGQRVQIAEFGQLFMGGLQYLAAGEHLFYAAPEQLATGDFNEGRGRSWDVYAFGVVAFELLTGHLPRLHRVHQHHRENPSWLDSAAAITFGELSELTEYFLAHLQGERQVEWPGAHPERREAVLQEVISSCLRFEAGERPGSMMEVAASLRSPGMVRASALASKGSGTVRSAEPAVISAAAAGFAAEDRSAPVSGDESGLFEPLVGPPASVSRERGKESGFPGRLGNPVLRWQLTAIGFSIVSLALSVVAIFNYLNAREAKNHIEEELQRELQANVNKQAEAYRRMQAEQVRNKQLLSELNESEDSKNSLLGQAKLARQLLRETQENGDRFFRLVLENRDSDVPGFRASRAAALEDGRKHYERLVETYGDAPDFIVSTADALFYLGRIYRELGEFGRSLAAFGEAERRYSALLEDESTARVDFVRNIALSKSALGELSVRSGQYSVARHYFTESSRFWTEARSREPVIAPVAALHIHENSLAIVECELAMDRLDAAGDAAMSVGVRLTEMQKEDPDNPGIVGALAKSFALVGRVLEARRDTDLARQSYQQAGDLYARAIELDAAVDEFHLGLGNSLARVGILTNDHEKLSGAAEVLGRVAASNPYESAYLKTLADIYGILATGQRDGGRVKDAVALEEKAISILKPIVERNRSVAPDVKFSYSQRLAHLAELLGDSGRFDDSREPLKEAISLLEEIASADGAAAEYRRSLARTRGMAGFACMKSGDPGEAKEHLRLAKTEWQSFMASNPDDNDAAQAVKWTSEQLESLQ
jgi:tetratricopeptide (TPR) repeat protein